MKGKLLSILIFTISIAFSQEGDKKRITDIFNKTAQVYNSASIFQSSMKYSLYPTYTSKNSSEQYSGIAIKKDKEYYSKIGETEIISLSSCQIKVDNESKLMQYIKSEKQTKENSVVEIKSYLTNFSTYAISSNEKEWICTLSTPSFSMIPYTKVVVHINKENYTISKQIFFLITTQKYKTKEGVIKEDYPRVEIVFNEFKTKDVIIGSLFSIQNYLSIDKNKVSPSNKYKGYKIVE